MIGIIDYGMGNLHSVTKALLHIGVETRVVDSAEEIARCEKLILPGVGAFPQAMQCLAPLADSIRSAVGAGTPLLGICLGLQLLFEGSTECGGAVGLGLLPGEVTCFTDVPEFPRELRVPHMGWADLTELRGELFASISMPCQSYFVHSYFAPLGEYTVAQCVHGIAFTAAAQSGNIYATQYHPEKSGAQGIQMLANFAKL